MINGNVVCEMLIMGCSGRVDIPQQAHSSFVISLPYLLWDTYIVFCRYKAYLLGKGMIKDFFWDIYRKGINRKENFY